MCMSLENALNTGFVFVISESVLTRMVQPNTRIRITEISGYQDYPAATLES